MKLLYPEFLWAFFALLIPIIIHLFNFRKFQKVYFSDISLLKEVKLETKSKSRLKHLLVLFTRLLALSALILAFCYPYIPADEKEQLGDYNVSIYIDNSQSMDSKGTNGYRLELAKVYAEEIVNSYGPSDKFQIITNEFKGLQQRLYNKKDALALIDEIQPTFNSRKISDVYKRQSELLSKDPTAQQMFWLSDFQSSTTDINNLELDSLSNIKCLPFDHSKGNNLYIDSIWFNTPIRNANSEDGVFVRVYNASDQEMSFKLTLSINDAQQGFINQEVNADTYIDCKIPFTVRGNGVQHAKLELSDYPNPELSFDDTFYFSYFVKAKINVLNIHQANYSTDSSGYLGSLLGSNKSFNYSNAKLSQIEFGEFTNQDLIILENLDNLSSGLVSELKTFVLKGGALCIFPSQEANISSYNDLLSEIKGLRISSKSTASGKIHQLNSDHVLFDNVFESDPNKIDLPKVFSYYPIRFNVSSGVSWLMKQINGDDFLVTGTAGKGTMFLFASPLDKSASTLPNHAIFVPVLLKIGEFSNSNSEYYKIIGKENSVLFTQADAANQEGISIVNKQNNNSFIPEILNSRQKSELLLFDQISSAGHYDVLLNNKLVQGFSFNYDREESIQSFKNVEKLQEEINLNGFSEQITIFEGVDSEDGFEVESIEKAKKYWWYLILLTLIFLTIEVALLRLWK